MNVNGQCGKEMDVETNGSDNENKPMGEKGGGGIDVQESNVICRGGIVPLQTI